MNASSVLLLVLTVAISPALLGAAHRIRLPRVRPWFYAGYASLVAAYVAGVTEDYVAGEILNLIQHGAFVVTGIAALGGASMLRAAVLAAEGGED